MKLSLFQLLPSLFLLSLMSCKTSYPVTSQQDEIDSKEVDGVTILYIGEEINQEQTANQATDRNCDESNIGKNGRKIIKRNWRELFKGRNQTKYKGKIAIMYCVNPEGEVTYAEILPDETMETDPRRLKQALKAAKGYRVQADPNASPEECGKLIFNLEIN